MAFAIDIQRNLDTSQANLTDLVIPVYESITLADYTKLDCSNGPVVGTKKKCKPFLKKLDVGSKLRVLSQEKGKMYKVQAFDEDGNYLGIFHTSKKFADQALNWTSVRHSLGMLQESRNAGWVPDMHCNYGIQLYTDTTAANNPHVQPVVVRQDQFTDDYVADLESRHSSTVDGDVRPRARPVRISGSTTPVDNSSNADLPERTSPPRDYNGEFHPGCEVLKNDPLSADDKEKMKECIQSIRDVIASGDARNPDGSLHRENTYSNMFKYLNPVEQSFAAKIFTSIGEVEVLKNEADYMSIMKVLENRAHFAREKSGDEYNELDAALAEWQFSMYNKAEPGWRRLLDPGKNIDSGSIDMALNAMIKLESTDTRKYDNVYMYHADYVTPRDWDFNLLSEPFAMNFGDGQVTKTEGTRHLFYRPKNGLQGVYIGNYRKRRRDAQ